MSKPQWWAEVRQSKVDAPADYDYHHRPEAEGGAFFADAEAGQNWCSLTIAELAHKNDLPLSVWWAVVEHGTWARDVFTEDRPARSWVCRWDDLEETWVWAFSGPSGLEVLP